MSAGFIARALTGAVKFYRALPRSRPPSCRFDPTCSQYALDALRGWGALRGAWLAVKRICRCHPWGGWGYDPVPARAVPTQDSHPESVSESDLKSDSANEASEHSCST